MQIRQVWVATCCCGIDSEVLGTVVKESNFVSECLFSFVFV